VLGRPILRAPRRARAGADYSSTEPEVRTRHLSVNRDRIGSGVMRPAADQLPAASTEVEVS
jgi:hypothetical protein